MKTAVKMIYAIFGPQSRMSNEMAIESFEIAGDALYSTTCLCQKMFRPNVLRIFETFFEDEACIEYLEVRSIMIGMVEQLRSPVPARMFGSNVYGVYLDMPAADVGQHIAIRIRNYSPDNVRIAMIMEGVSLASPKTYIVH